MVLILVGLEIEKISGYWCVKGFKQSGIFECLECEDGYIVYQWCEWCMYDLEIGKLIIKVGIFWGLLKKIY